jgi:hypothetical protein
MVRILRKASGGKPLADDWNARGRLPIVSEHKLDEVADSLQQESGRALGKREVREMLEKQVAQSHESQGLVPPSDRVSRVSVSRYLYRIGARSNISIASSAVKKTDSRATMENSFISAVALALVIAFSHFVIVGENHRFQTKVYPKLPEGSKVLVDFLQDYHKAPVCPVRPSLVLSMDDSTEYAFVTHPQEAPRCKSNRHK